MKPLLSIAVPSIRTHLLEHLYSTIEANTQISWEISICSPYDLPDSLKKKKNVIFTQSYRSPSACQAIAIEKCSGVWQTYLADDATILPAWLSYTNLPSLSDDWKTAYLAFYGEGGDLNRPDSYYRLNNALPRSPYLSDDFYVFNVAIFRRELYNYVGGISAEFDTTFFCHTDLGIRIQSLEGLKVKVFNQDIASCLWEEGRTQTHWAIHDRHIGKDEYLYKQKYCSDTSPDFKKIRQNIKHWLQTQEKWYRFI